jgi:hypothetical protein
MVYGFGDNVTIRGNKLIVDYGASYDVNANIGISTYSGEAESGTYYSFHKNIDVSDNLIKGFHIGIMSRSGKSNDNNDHAWRNLKISNNKCIQKEYSQTANNIGILSDAGADISDNYIYTPNAESTGIRVDSFDPDGTIESQVNGALVRKNNIVGLGTDIVVNGYNNYVLDNYINNAVSFQIAEYSPSGITQPFNVALNPAETKMYILNGSDDTIYEYELSVAGLLSTASPTGNTLDVTPQTGGNGKGLFMKPDGTKLFVCDNSNIYAFSLTTAFDISSGSYASESFNYSAQLSFGKPFITPDGTKLLLISEAGSGAVYSYTLSTEFNVSTASYDTDTFTTGLNQAFSVFYNADGTKLYGVAQNEIKQWTLSTAYELSSAGSEVSFDLSSYDTTVRSGFIPSDGTKLFICGDENNKIFRFNFGTAYDLSTLAEDDLGLTKQGNVIRSITETPTYW